jgi:beta-barrel assembly-enhancing protease
MPAIARKEGQQAIKHGALTTQVPGSACAWRDHPGDKVRRQITLKKLMWLQLTLLFFGWSAEVTARAQQTHAVPPQQLADSSPGSPKVPPESASLPAIHKVTVPTKYDVGRIGDRGIGGGVNFYSLEKEELLGRELAQEVEHGSQLLTDPLITEYVNRLGQRLVRNSDAKVPFTIKVLDNDEVNALALPGGFFYVNSGLVLAAQTEAELAGVMAHEIAHVAARHATRNETKAEIWNLISIPLIFAGGPAGCLVRQAAGVLLPMSFLKFSRNAEREADLLGIEYEYATGYDPQALVELLERLQAGEKKHASFVARTFSTHPMTADRVRAAQKEIADYLPPREEYIVTTSEFEGVKARLEMLENRHHIDLGQSRPTLRHRQRPTQTTPPTDDKGDKSEDDSRPTLKRQLQW